jgi:hypothetical protein
MLGKGERIFSNMMKKVSKIDAIKTWRKYLGPAKNAAEEAPETFRARFESSEINPIHAADSHESVEAERSIIFKDDEEAIALIKPDAFEQVKKITNFFYAFVRQKILLSI